MSRLFLILGKQDGLIECKQTRRDSRYERVSGVDREGEYKNKAPILNFKLMKDLLYERCVSKMYLYINFFNVRQLNFCTLLLTWPLILHRDVLY